MEMVAMERHQAGLLKSSFCCFNPQGCGMLTDLYSSGIGGGGGAWKQDGQCPFYNQICGKGKPGNFVGGQPIYNGYVEGLN